MQGNQKKIQGEEKLRTQAARRPLYQALKPATSEAKINAIAMAYEAFFTEGIEAAKYPANVSPTPQATAPTALALKNL